MDAVAASDSTDKEEAVKDAQPQPIENGGSKEAAVENAELKAAPTTSAETSPEAEEEKEEGEIEG